MIKIYTDGASRGNPGPGGYGVVLAYEKQRKELVEGFRTTTNNRMELLAAIVGLEALKQPGSRVLLYTDSRYVVDAIAKGWLYHWLKIDFKGKKNKDLWKRFWPLYRQHQVAFEWLKGHAGHLENERCDQLAVAAALHGPWQIDEGYEKSLANAETVRSYQGL